MNGNDKGRIAIDDLVETATSGVLRALEARDIGKRFLDQNGLLVRIDIICGGFPGPLMKELLQSQQGGIGPG